MAEKIATRAAYGKALVELADQEPNLVVLDQGVQQGPSRPLLQHGHR